MDLALNWACQCNLGHVTTSLSLDLLICTMGAIILIPCAQHIVGIDKVAHVSETLCRWVDTAAVPFLTLGAVLPSCPCPLETMSLRFLLQVTSPECWAWGTLLLARLGFLWAQSFTRTHSFLRARRNTASDWEIVASVLPALWSVTPKHCFPPNQWMHSKLASSLAGSCPKCPPFYAPAHWGHALTHSGNWESFPFLPACYWKWYLVLSYISLAISEVEHVFFSV